MAIAAEESCLVHAEKYQYFGFAWVFTGQGCGFRWPAC
jgi:hypothetical protein